MRNGTLKLDFVLDYERLLLGINGLGELGRDGVVSSLVLENQALVTFDTLVDGGLLDLPVANKGPLFLSVAALGVDFLFGVRCLPSCGPVVGELLKEWGFEAGGLFFNVSSSSCGKPKEHKGESYLEVGPDNFSASLCVLGQGQRRQVDGRGCDKSTAEVHCESDGPAGSS